ncbi:MAG: hypothetical protein IPM34_03450 [Saprospiraceae bacterium]|nr:hypothetical protein [Saprospiraceae bacterium]
MKNLLIFPQSFRTPGWILFFCSFIAGIACLGFEWELDFLKLKTFAIYGDVLFGQDTWLGIIEDNLTLEFIGVFFVLGILFLGFSRMKQEDEYTLQMRYNALMWAALASCILLIFTMLFFYGSGYFYCMIFNMFSIPCIYILRFSYLYHQSQNNAE